MGIYRIRGGRPVILVADFLGAQHRPGMPRTFRNHHGGGYHIDVLLAGHYQYCNDHGINAGGRRAIAVYQLWRIVGHHDGHRYRIVDEYKYATVYDRMTINEE